jgi:hypothetical protein
MTNASALAVCVQKSAISFGIEDTDAGRRSCTGEPVRAKFKSWAAMSHLTRKGPKSLVIRRAWACVIPCFLAK